ncbi:phasin family protein [Paraburkholderia saeva]|uniref:phasin family protein n=1 Tax=Paraburkholderia saeva TaxID=2777537 RepID=UPI001DBCDFCD|nr:phasin family protein [Paraburkholderia saeva]CAG4886188.1 hypothetical protein R70241_00138 [Paraburkholderia saeva]CAG4901687.1 hypothetical protein R52603_02881 [Paraburkholderia saeva]
MNTVVEQSTAFGQRTFPVLVSLQLEAFEWLQKLTQLNLAAMKTSLDEVQGALSSGEFASAPFAAGAGLPRQIIERSMAYAHHVQDIDAKFQGAVIEAGQNVVEQYRTTWSKLATSMEHTEPFGPNGVMSAMQPAVAAFNQSLGAMHESFRYMPGAAPSPEVKSPDQVQA